MKEIYTKDSDIIINNPNSKATITSCHFIVLSNSNYNIKRIEIRKNGLIKYEQIYEKTANKVYKEKNNLYKSLEEENVSVLKKLTNSEIQEVLSLIGYNKLALDLFNEYLKENTKIKEPQTTVVVEKNVNIIYKNVGKTIRSNGPISSFRYIQQTLGDKYEKRIELEMDEKINTIYYCLLNISGQKPEIEFEMNRELNEEQIDFINTIISKDNDAVDIFNEYLQTQTKNKIR